MLPAFTYFFVRRIISTSLIITGIPFAVPISAEYLFSSVEKSELFLISFTFKMYQYDYKTDSGELFTCCAPTLEKCREKRDAWLKSKHLA